MEFTLKNTKLHSNFMENKLKVTQKCDHTPALFP